MSKHLIMQAIGLPVLKAYFSEVKDALRSFEGFEAFALSKGVNFNYEVKKNTNMILYLLMKKISINIILTHSKNCAKILTNTKKTNIR